jgi:hypothetical protein
LMKLTAFLSGAMILGKFNLSRYPESKITNLPSQAGL